MMCLMLWVGWVVPFCSYNNISSEMRKWIELFLACRTVATKDSFFALSEGPYPPT